ncbi:MAG: MerR family transcriptional regulator [Chloroflexota bacterium]
MSTTIAELNQSREDSHESFYKIGEVADITGLTQRSIRYYEERGLLHAPTRTQGDYRLYSKADINRLEDIVRLKSLLGFSLAEIKEIVEGVEALGHIHSEYHAADDVATRLLKLDEATDLTRKHLAMLEAKVGQMVVMQEELNTKLLRYIEKREELMGELAGDDEA